MSGRNKRLGQAYLRALAWDIRRRDEQAEELRSAQEWRRTGIEGIVAELTARLGGTIAGALVAAWQDFTTDTFVIAARYRGNRVSRQVAISELRKHRTSTLEWLETKCRPVLRMPCRHEGRPVAKRAFEPPIFLQSPESIALIGEIVNIASRIELHCPDCDAIVGGPS